MSDTAADAAYKCLKVKTATSVTTYTAAKSAASGLACETAACADNYTVLTFGASSDIYGCMAPDTTNSNNGYGCAQIKLATSVTTISAARTGAPTAKCLTAACINSTIIKYGSSSADYGCIPTESTATNSNYKCK